MIARFIPLIETVPSLARYSGHSLWWWDSVRAEGWGSLQMESSWVPDHGGCQPEPGADGQAGPWLTQLSRLLWPSLDAQVLVQLISGSPIRSVSVVTRTAPSLHTVWGLDMKFRGF